MGHRIQHLLEHRHLPLCARFYPAARAHAPDLSLRGHARAPARCAARDGRCRWRSACGRRTRRPPAECPAARAADRGQEHALARGHRDLVGLAGEIAERTGHPAAARVQHLDLEPGPGQQARARPPIPIKRRLVAMPVDERPATTPRWLPAITCRARAARRAERSGRRAGVRALVGHQLAELVAQHRGAAGLEHEHRHAGLDRLGDRVEKLAQRALGGCEHAEVVQRPAAAQSGRRQLDGEPGRVEHLHRGLPDIGLEQVRERVGPEQHSPRSPREAGRRCPSNQAPERLMANRGALRSVATPSSRFPAGASRGVAERVGQPRRARGDRSPPRQPAEHVVVQRAQAAGVVVGEELRLVGGHVDLHGTVSGAALAGQAQVERFLDRIVAPPSVIGSPWSISNRSRARPRVLWRSSRVTWKLGHMVRLPRLRHLAIPKHRSTAVANDPSSSG